ncbi:MAG: dicarboxylate/amino acid:cation symporter [Planctomycetes bacterium]|nr:dicarboxylate/amino acid:cation symporter [Planctomycetota bacterium]
MTIAGPPPQSPPVAAHPRGLALHWQILIGLLCGAVAGLIAGQVWPAGAGDGRQRLLWFSANVAQPVGQIFLRLIFMVVIPLVFCALAVGVAGLGEIRKLGRVGGRTLLLTAVFSMISVIIAIGLVNLVKPGRGLSEQQQADLRTRFASEAGKAVEAAKQSKPLRDALLDIIPRNPLREMVGAIDNSSPGGGMLAVMFFALVFGAALLAAGPKGAPLVAVLDAGFEVCMKVIGFAMRLAPAGVAGLMFALTAELGLDILRVLAVFVLTAIAGLALHMFGTYGVALRWFAKRSPLEFFRGISDVMLTAFATASSNATLPTALRAAETRLRLRPQVSNFVLTVGATANQNGTALFEGVTVLFLAQVFGVPLSLEQQLVVAAMCVLAGIGTAGVPGGSIPYIAIVLQTVHVPAESVALILGVDRLLDMCRTTVNVSGDLAIAACVDQAER